MPSGREAENKDRCDKIAGGQVRHQIRDVAPKDERMIGGAGNDAGGNDQRIVERSGELTNRLVRDPFEEAEARELSRPRSSSTGTSEPRKGSFDARGNLLSILLRLSPVGACFQWAPQSYGRLLLALVFVDAISLGDRKHRVRSERSSPLALPIRHCPPLPWGVSFVGAARLQSL